MPAKQLKIEVSESLVRTVKTAALAKDQFLRDWLIDAIKDKLILEGFSIPEEPKSDLKMTLKKEQTK